MPPYDEVMKPPRSKISLSEQILTDLDIKRPEFKVPPLKNPIELIDKRS